MSGGAGQHCDNPSCSIPDFVPLTNVPLYRSSLKLLAFPCNLGLLNMQ